MLGSSDEQVLLPAPESTAFFDLTKDPAIFEGDGEEDLQYDMYRYMRAAVLYGDPMAPERLVPKPRGKRGVSAAPIPKNKGANTDDEGDASRSPWEQHHPLTNLIWLHFLHYKLTEQLAEWPSACPQPSFVPGRHRARRIREKALALERRLQDLTEMLDLQTMKDRRETLALGSARELVGWAVEAGWLREEEVLGIPQQTWESDKESGCPVNYIADELERKLHVYHSEGEQGVTGGRGRRKDAVD